jgi:hypothetical protein
MKKELKAYYLILILVFLATGLESQDLSTVRVTENLQVCTDRTMYISGEKILFSAGIFIQDGALNDKMSRILYIEIITPDGTRVTGGKYPLEHSSAQGCLKIPEESVTGIYYLKSYTRFMRNGVPESYHYNMLKIINPNKEEVLTSHGVEDTALSGKDNITGPNSGWTMNISSGENKFSARDSIRLKIAGSRGTSIPEKMCLTVIPDLAYSAAVQAGAEADSSKRALQFYPETRGLSITGTVQDSKTDKPIPSDLVNLSIIGDKDMMAIRTDSSGRYFFALPYYYGDKDIFLCAENSAGNPPVIFIENDFCPKPVNLHSLRFHLTEEEKETAYRMAVNQKIASKFPIDTLANGTSDLKNGKPFYGEPTEVLVMDKYIDLPTIEEYFNELPLEVKVRKSQGRQHFRFYTDRAEMTIYDPLVLVDWVAIDDIDRVLAMQPKALDRIELVNSPYIKGNITYGGIISFVSKNNDFAGIDLPSSGTFINYKFLEECSANISEKPLPANLPDSRNTVYWDPDVRISDNGSKDIYFTTPDTPGKYIILLRALTRTGEQVIAKEEFEVAGK